MRFLTTCILIHHTISFIYLHEIIKYLFSVNEGAERDEGKNYGDHLQVANNGWNSKQPEEPTNIFLPFYILGTLLKSFFF